MNNEMALRITRARTNLLLDHPWFGSLALRLIVREDERAPTIQTDGTSLEYNPTWCAQWSDKQLVGLIAHEVMHCAMIHPYRMDARDPMIWNIAADIAINQIIRENGFELPPTELHKEEAKYQNMNVEAIYAALMDQKQKTGKSKKPDFGQHLLPSKTGKPQEGSAAEAAKDGGTPGPAQQGDDQSADAGGMTEFDWQVEAEAAAMVARKAGTMPGNVDSQLKRTREAKVDWTEVLRRFVEQVVPNDYSWATPNRRHVYNNTYLPGVVRENQAYLVVARDTSGSVSDAMQEQFAGETIDIVRDVRPARIVLLQCDTRIVDVQEYTADDFEIDLSVKGRGGTAFQPVFDWLAQQDEQPAALIYMTDMECYDQPQDPEIPVLWVAPEWATKEQTFGELVKIPDMSYE